MKTKHVALIAAITVGLLIAGACSRGRTDVQISSDIQAKIGSDLRLANKQIAVQAKNGVVTLTGKVDTPAERDIVQNYAAAIEGVKSVTNNLEVGAAAPAPAAAEVPGAGKEKAAVKPAKRVPEHPPARPTAPAAEAAAAAKAPAPPAEAGAPAVPPAPPAPERVTIPAGTDLTVRLIDAIDTKTNQPGDKFRATLEEPVVIDERTVVPKGADVEGKVAELASAGKFQGRSELTVVLTKLSYAGRSYGLTTEPLHRQGASRGTRTAEVVGGGAALGAIIGGIAGGGKGAGIGAVSGAGAGTGVQAVTRGQQIKLASEALVDFKLKTPLTVRPVASLPRR
jgi:hypothetical protein